MSASLGQTPLELKSQPSKRHESISGSVQLEYNRSVELLVPSVSSRPGQRNSDLYRRLSCLPHRSAPKEISDSGDLQETLSSAKELPPTSLRPGVSVPPDGLIDPRCCVEANPSGRRQSCAASGSCSHLDDSANISEFSLAEIACESTPQRPQAPQKDMEVVHEPIEERRIGTLPGIGDQLQEQRSSHATYVAEQGVFKGDLSGRQDPNELPLMQALSLQRPNSSSVTARPPQVSPEEGSQEYVALDTPTTELQKSCRSPGYALKTELVSALPSAGVKLEFEALSSAAPPAKPFRSPAGLRRAENRVSKDAGDMRRSSKSAQMHQSFLRENGSSSREFTEEKASGAGNIHSLGQVPALDAEELSKKLLLLR